MKRCMARIFSAVVLGLGLLAGGRAFSAGAAEAAAAAAPELPRVIRVLAPTVRDAAQDDTGRVWAVTDLGLAWWSGAGWTSVPASALTLPAPDLVLKQLVRGDGGAVLALWQKANGTPPAMVTRHRGDEKSLVFRFDGKLPAQPRVWEFDGRVWITGNGPEILARTAADDAPAIAYTIPAGQGLETHNDDGRPAGVMAARDGQGRVWFWVESAGDRRNRGPIGFLVWEAGAFTPIPDMPGLPDNTAVQFAALKDGRTLLAVLGRSDLYEIDTESRLAVLAPVHPLQLQQGFLWLRSLPGAGGGAAETVTVTRSGQVWSCRAGEWRQVTQLDNVTTGADPRPFWVARTEGCLWLAGFTPDVRLLPDGTDTAVSLGWRQGVPASAANRIFKLPDGRILFLSTLDFRGAFSLAGGAAIARAPVADVQVFTAPGRLFRDGAGRIWRVGGPAGRVTLQSWTGSAWQDQAPPDGERLNSAFFTAFDSRGRIWCLAETSNAVLVFDPAGGVWRRYGDSRRWDENFLRAVLAERAPNEALRVGQPEDGGALVTLPFAETLANGSRTVTVTDSRSIRIHDGKEWQIWRLGSVAGQEFRTLDSLAGPPGFDSTGRPMLTYRTGRVFCFQEDKSWKELLEKERPASAKPAAPPPVAVPSGCVTATPESLVRDGQGRVWLTWNGMLYRMPEAGGPCEPYFAPNAAQPFLDGRRLRRVVTDRAGGVFLDTQAGAAEWVYLPPPKP